KHAESAAGKECQIPIYQNFLGDPPLALYNLPVDPTNGTVSIELDANYTQRDEQETAHDFTII
ncbi:MAG: hypothetical protein P4M11_14045, partial [Candidatus Pacebacteria bacterium]|nr:hypothetical protein [Candidatus Paceibacterota bacterium]